jgi:hypothetical protein
MICSCVTLHILSVLLPLCIPLIIYILIHIDDRKVERRKALRRLKEECRDEKYVETFYTIIKYKKGVSV